MQDCPVLNIGAVANLDAIYIGSDYGVIPNIDAIANMDIANYHCITGNKSSTSAIGRWYPE